MTAKQVIHPKISLENYKRCKRLQDDRKVSIGSIVDAALDEYFKDDSSGNAQLEALYAQLQHITKKQNFMGSNIKLLTEMLALYIRVFLTNTDELPSSQLENGLRRGLRRFDDFTEKVAQNLHGRDGMTDELMHQMLLMEQEMATDVDHRGEFEDGKPQPSKGLYA